MKEYFEKSPRKGLEALLLWCTKENHGENSWLYGVYNEQINKLSVNKMKALIEISTYDMVPAVVNGIIDVYSVLFCKEAIK